MGQRKSRDHYHRDGVLSQGQGNPEGRPAFSYFCIKTALTRRQYWHRHLRWYRCFGVGLVHSPQAMISPCLNLACMSVSDTRRLHRVQMGCWFIVCLLGYILFGEGGRDPQSCNRPKVLSCGTADTVATSAAGGV